MAPMKGCLPVGACVNAYVVACATVLVVAGVAASASGQTNTSTNSAMVALANEIGVPCAYCHVAGANKRLDYKSDSNPKKAVARKMIEMTADINARVWLATGTEAARTTETGGAKSVSCVTCHRGVPIPLPIAVIVARAIEREGPQAAVAQYRELRSRFYERDAYDFTEVELLRIAKLYVDSDPDATIALLRMNLEWRPSSAVSYVVMAYAYTRKLDDKAAIPLLEKALDIEPENGPAQGYLHQLRRFQSGVRNK